MASNPSGDELERQGSQDREGIVRLNSQGVSTLASKPSQLLESINNKGTLNFFNISLAKTLSFFLNLKISNPLVHDLSPNK